MHTQPSAAELADAASGVPSSRSGLCQAHRSAKWAVVKRARGYTQGMLAQTSGPHPGFETFMTDLLTDFSVDPVKGKD
jgi:hypothetical protein